MGVHCVIHKCSLATHIFFDLQIALSLKTSCNFCMGILPKALKDTSSLLN
jgi:cytochrome c peroxidase